MDSQSNIFETKTTSDIFTDSYSSAHDGDENDKSLYDSDYDQHQDEDLENKETENISSLSSSEDEDDDDDNDKFYNLTEEEFDTYMSEPIKNSSYNGMLDGERDLKNKRPPKVFVEKDYEEMPEFIDSYEHAYFEDDFEKLENYFATIGEHLGNLAYLVSRNDRVLDHILRNHDIKDLIDFDEVRKNLSILEKKCQEYSK